MQSSQKCGSKSLNASEALRLLQKQLCNVIKSESLGTWADFTDSVNPNCSSRKAKGTYHIPSAESQARWEEIKFFGKDFHTSNILYNKNLPVVIKLSDRDSN